MWVFGNGENGQRGAGPDTVMVGPDITLAAIDVGVGIVWLYFSLKKTEFLDKSKKTIGIFLVFMFPK